MLYRCRIGGIRHRLSDGLGSLSDPVPRPISSSSPSQLISPRKSDFFLFCLTKLTSMQIATFADSIPHPNLGTLNFHTFALVWPSPPSSPSSSPSTPTEPAIYIWLGPSSPTPHSEAPPSGLLNELAVAMPAARGQGQGAVSTLIGVGVDERSAGLARRFGGFFFVNDDDIRRGRKIEMGCNRKVGGWQTTKLWDLPLRRVYSRVFPHQVPLQHLDPLSISSSPTQFSPSSNNPPPLLIATRFKRPFLVSFSIPPGAEDSELIVELEKRAFGHVSELLSSGKAPKAE